MAYMELNLYSRVLNLDIPVSMILPQRPEEPLKTIWLYHGSTGDHTLWARYTNLERYARERNLAVVIPTAHKSMFTNMVHGQEYGTFLGEELVARLRQIFPCLSERREDNYVGGLSNGAYGAFRIGLRYPEMRETSILPMTAHTVAAVMYWSLARAARQRASMA